MDSDELLFLRPRVYRCGCRRRFPLQRESNPLFRAVLSSNLKDLMNLVESGSPINIQNEKGSSLLNFTMRRKRVEIFDYLLSLDQLDVNFRDRLEQTPLLYLAGVCFDEYFALKLLRKGADVHLTDDSGNSFLHLAARCDTDDNVKVGQMIIEKGADINARGSYGITPLYAACEIGNVDWIHMLLYYGADVTIPSHKGILPLAILTQDIEQKELIPLQEILFNYTFSDGRIPIRLPTLVSAMTLDPALFERILQQSDISYNLSDLQYMISYLIHLRPENLKLFINKFGHIVKEMIENFSPLDVMNKIPVDGIFSGMEGIIDIFLNSEYVSEFIQVADPTFPTISRLLKLYNNRYHFVKEEQVTEIICLMLSYGLGVTSCDLDMVYSYYNYCELFRILLRMEITMIDSNTDCRSMAVLYYDVNSSIDDFLNDVSVPPNLLYYYNHPKLKEICVANHHHDEEIIEQVKNMPEVASLVELSRNAARKFIVKSYNIKNSSQFYTALDELPIGKMNKNIIALEKKLY